MGFFRLGNLSRASLNTATADDKAKQSAELPRASTSDASPAIAKLAPIGEPETIVSDSEESEESPLPIAAPETPSALVEDKENIAKQPARRFSISLWRHKAALTATDEHEKEHDVKAALSKHRVLASNSDRKAQETAYVVRDLIIGPAASKPKVAKVTAKPQLSRVKSQLMKPKSANKVIAHLRDLSVEDAQADKPRARPGVPIHAVCLQHTDEEENTLNFRRLHDHGDEQSDHERELDFSFPSVSSAPLDKLAAVFNEMRIIDLIRTPDFGLGQAGDGPGILAGALPTAETVMNGITEITPQLVALGYATGKAISADHTGIFPPLDRMSVFTYWWGLELALPPPSLKYLGSAHSITGAVVNFLSAVALVNNGVREILPFVRYISQFIDFEFNAVKGQDKGKGVVCAATWIMPAAMVPRPWDFPAPPASVVLTPPKLLEVEETDETEKVDVPEGVDDDAVLKPVSQPVSPVNATPGTPVGGPDTLDAVPTTSPSPPSKSVPLPHDTPSPSVMIPAPIHIGIPLESLSIEAANYEAFR